MVKEELYIITEAGKEQLDLASPSGITLKWVSNLFNDISKLTCSYSYTFKLPVTSRNRRILNLADDIRHDNGMLRKAVNAEFYVNGVCLCPNANLYVSELTDTFQCVMTWKVLKGFETLKSSSGKLTDLDPMGTIVWGGDEAYGGTSSDISNMDEVVYPDYDAGVPHEAGTPPKPCVPVYRLIQMINETYGVKFNIGSLLTSRFGLMPKGYLNNASYYGKRVYDDYVTYGVIPLVNGQVSNERFTIRGINDTGEAHTMKFAYLEYTQKWDVARFGSGSLTNPLWISHWKLVDGEYTGLDKVENEHISAQYRDPKIIAFGIPLFERLSGNEFIKPLYAFQHDTSLACYRATENGRLIAQNYFDQGAYCRWGTRTYTGVEQVCDTFSGDEAGGMQIQTSVGVECIENSVPGVPVVAELAGDMMKNVGIIGFSTNEAFTLRGYCDLRISKAAVDAGRVDVSGYMWICLAKITKSDDESEAPDIEAVTEKDIQSSVGFQSLDIPTYDAASNTYVCHFDFGVNYDARRIEIDSDDDEDLVGYIMLPYFPDDQMKELDVSECDVQFTKGEDNGTSVQYSYVVYYNGRYVKGGTLMVDSVEEPELSQDEFGTVTVLDLEEGDLSFEGLYISRIEPSVEVVKLPASINVTKSLPDISCFDFMKSVFYMNGAMPRVERDGKTISAMYYNQLRNRVNDGEAVDWSKKLLSPDKDLASSTKFHNTSFARDNYLEMAGSTREKTDDELAEELDVYGEGYGTIEIDDRTLNEETSVFTSAFYQAYIQNLRFPLVKVGRTCKVWEGDKTLAEDVSPIYGIMVYRSLDPTYEDTKALRPGISDVTANHIRMNIFSPFDNEEMMAELFGYFQTVLNNYKLVKEKFLLDEIDLRDFDESVPVYLSKYNSYFAVSSIQRDKDGISTVELIKLPRVKSDIGTIDTSYEVEILSAGYITFETGYDDSSLNVYIKRNKDSEWEVYAGRKLDFGSDGIYAITADSKLADGVVLRIYATYVGQYRFTYTDPDSGERKSIVRSEANAYFDGKDWTASGKGYNEVLGTSQEWHRVEIDIPIRNQYNEIVETRKWMSPIFVSKKEYADYGEDEARYAVSGLSMLIYFKLNLTRDYTSNVDPICYEHGKDNTLTTPNNTLELPLDDGYVSRYVYPYEADRLRDDTYSVDLIIPQSVSYDLAKMVGFNTVESKRLSVKLRTYYDDARIVGNQTLTFSRSEFGQYHVFKLIADLTDDAGNVVQKIRKKVYWFVSSVNKGAITDDFGDEHEDDATIRVNDVAITGLSSIADYKENAYTLSFTPAYADVNVVSVEVSTSVGEQVLKVSNVTTAGFTLQAVTLPQSETGVTITVKANLEDGTSFTKTKEISILMPSIGIIQSGAATTGIITAVNGKGSARFYVVARPNNVSATVKSVSVSNSLFSVKDISGQFFTLSVDGITQSESTIIDVVAESNGIQLTGSLNVTAEMKNMWAVESLDASRALIVDVNGMFYNESEWKASGVENEDADGVAVSDGTHRFIIAKKQFTGVNGGKGTLVEGQFTTTDENTAYTDFNGKANTDAMIAALSSSAAHTIRGRNDFPSGQQGYYGTAGEWRIVQDNRNIIQTLLEAIGADELVTSVQGCEYLTSTQYNANLEWYFHFGTDNKVYSTDKDRQYHIRALAELKQVSAPVPRGYMDITGGDSFKAANGTGSATFGISYGPAGVTISEVSVSSSNSAVKVSLVSNTEFKLSVSNILVDEVTTVTVRARLNGLMATAKKQITAVGETVVDYDKLDAAHALILCKDYTLYTEDEWYSSGKSYNDVEGIAVSDGTHRVIVAREDAGNGQRYYFGGRGVNIEGLPTGSSDYDGEGNTLKIISAVTRSDGYFTDAPYSAAAVAHQNLFPSGKSGYLGASGEWGLVGKYHSEIDSLLSAVGGDALVKDYSFTYWVSTGQGDNVKAMCYHLYQSDGSVTARLESYCYRSRLCTIRPFRKF